MTQFNIPADNFNDDDDDEFGGGRLTKELIYGKRLRVPTTEESTVVVTDEDDEFGGARLTKELIYGNRLKVPSPEVVTTDVESVETDGEKISGDIGILLFSEKPKNNSFLVNRKEMTGIFDFENSNWAFNCDTEYDAYSKNFCLEQQTRRGLTTQIKGIHKNAPAKIYAQSPLVNAGRELQNSLTPKTPVEFIPPTRSIFHPLDYLEDTGHEVSIRPCSSYECRDRPNAYFSMYGHFLLAEILMVSEETVEQRILELLRAENGQRLEMTRRLRCVNPVGKTELDWVDLNHIVSIDGWEYNLCLRLIDTCAIHGVASYKSFCESVGVELLYKDNFTKEEKGDMVRMFIERFKDAEEYSLGDLEVYEALEKYDEKWGEVHELLGLSEFYQEPKLTVGGSVKNLFISALASTLEIHPQAEGGWEKEVTEVITKYIQPTSANDLRQSPKNTRATLAKVEGGRCRNNQPTVTKIEEIIIDIDIDGCYGEGQRNQDYFIGMPVIWDYDAIATDTTGTKNRYVTLREWLVEGHDVPVEKIIRGDWSDWGELVSGAWIARFSTLEPLEYAQDFFGSWFTESGHGVNVMSKFVSSIKADDEWDYTQQEEFDEEYGSLKIFNNENHNSLLQHDGLEWILEIATPRQRNEMLDKIVILASAVYPRSSMLVGNDSFKSKKLRLDEIYKNWKGENTTKRVKEKGKNPFMQRNEKSCHAWFGINLGTLLINNLIIQRKIAKKVYGKGSPLDKLFKLCVNTLYGDMVSKFFVTANPVVGNNITARARAMAWYMEKGLNGFQPITDGCAFILNGVLSPGQDLINGECINLQREGSKLTRRKVTKIPLGGSTNQIKWVRLEYTITNEKEEIETKTEWAPHLANESVDLPPRVEGKEGKEYIVLPALEWVNEKSFEHLRNLFPKVSVLHKETTKIEVVKDGRGGLKPEFIKRIGQFSFEVKNFYTEGSFHGSANYVFKNPNDTLIKPEDRTVKARGYNVNNPHWSVSGQVIEYEDGETDVTNLKQSKRYGTNNNPAKDLLHQLLENPSKIIRQEVAYKTQILKPSEYRDNYEKYDALGIQPGDNIKKCFLMQEFSISQFTFKTYKQYMMWKKCVEKGKLKNKQSIEGHFLNEDGTLNYQEMIETVDKMISTDVLDPLRELDKNRHRNRTPVKVIHPQFGVWNAVRDKLGEVSNGDQPDDDWNI